MARYAVRFFAVRVGRAGSDASTRLLLFCRPVCVDSSQYLLESGLLCGIFDGKTPSIAAIASLRAAIDWMNASKTQSERCRRAERSESTRSSASSDRLRDSEMGFTADWSRIPPCLQFSESDVCSLSSELAQSPSRLVQTGFNVRTGRLLHRRPASTSTPTLLAARSLRSCRSCRLFVTNTIN